MSQERKITVGKVMKILREQPNYDSKFNPYFLEAYSDNITYGELAYLLTYALGKNLYYNEKENLKVGIDYYLDVRFIGKSVKMFRPQYKLSKYFTFYNYRKKSIRRMGLTKEIPLPMVLASNYLYGENRTFGYLAEVTESDFQKYFTKATKS